MDRHVAVVGLGFGDEGKGATVDWLCRRDWAPKPIAVVRLGGHQAAHNVVLADGTHHTFAQFGSGTLARVPTYLSRYMTVDPLGVALEAEHLEQVGVENPFETLTVDPSCRVVTPFHWRANLLNAQTLLHGSTGRGHGESTRLALSYPEEVLRVRDLDSIHVTLAILSLQARRFEREHGVSAGVDTLTLAHLYREFYRKVRVCSGDYIRMLLNSGTVIFEHSQGVLLDQDFGFHPHTTWSDTTFNNVDKLADGVEVYRLGVLRTYTTRHGNGPLPTETSQVNFPEPHNEGGVPGAFRTGYFDAVLHRYAIEACGRVDGLALTHLDRHGLRMCLSYEGGRAFHPVSEESRHLVGREWLTDRAFAAKPIISDRDPSARNVEEALGVPVVAMAFGPGFESRYRRDPALVRENKISPLTV